MQTIGLIWRSVWGLPSAYRCGWWPAASRHRCGNNGGDVPTPIPAQQTSGTTLDITMSIAGTFGDECNFHPGTMFGAIEVVP